MSARGAGSVLSVLFREAGLVNVDGPMMCASVDGTMRIGSQVLLHPMIDDLGCDCSVAHIKRLHFPSKMQRIKSGVQAAPLGMCCLVKQEMTWAWRMHFGEKILLQAKEQRLPTADPRST